MIEARNLKKTYKPKKGVAVHALDNVSVKLPSTGMVFILGKSGSGKSTLLNVLGGLDSFEEGEIIIKGVSAKNFKQSHYDSYRNTYVGFIFQEYNILEEFSVGANIALAIELQGRKAEDKEINDILEQVDLLDYANRKPNELSGGQKQRVAIARALVKKPEIIMADEPTGALDSATGKQVFDTLKYLSREKLVLVVSHDRDFAERYADRIIELADGKIISDVEISSCENENQSLPKKEITYEGKEIRIKKGYILTEEDRLAINAYIASLSSDAVIKAGSAESGEMVHNENKFIPTDESKIKIDNDKQFRLIKSKLGLKNSFKIGANALKYKKVRLIVTIFLSFIAFTLFGVSDTIASYNNVNTSISSIIDSKIDYASYIKMVKRSFSSGADYYWSSDSIFMSEGDIQTVSRDSGVSVKGVFKEYYKNLNFSANIKEIDTEASALFPNEFSGFTELTQKDLLDYGYLILGTNARLPDGNKNELAVSKYIYELFHKTGFTYYDETSTKRIDKEINSYDDLIGMEISLDYYGEYTITAIIDTGFDYSRYNVLTKNLSSDDAAGMIINMALATELSYAQNYSMHCVAFVGEGFVDNAKSNVSLMIDFSKYGYVNLFKYENGLAGGVNNKEDSTQNFLTGFNYIASFDSLKDKIIWFGDAKTSLSDNEYVIPLFCLPEIIKSSLDENILYSGENLTGFEQTVGELLSYNNLFDILNNTDIVSKYRFALDDDNYQEIFEIVEEMYNNGFTHGGDFASMSKQEIIDLYIYSYNGEQSKRLSEEYAEELLEKYSLGQLIMSKDKIDYIFPSVEYKGSIYNSYDRSVKLLSSYIGMYEELAIRKYVYTHMDEALEFFRLSNPSESSDNFYTVTDSYIRYLTSEKDTSDISFTPSTDIDAYVINEFVTVVNIEELLSGIYSDERVYSVYAESNPKSVSIVGVCYYTENNYNNSYFISSDNVLQKLTEGNKDAYFAYAVGPMPKDTQGISQAVKFSGNEYENAKYSLTNSVTYELDMVDSILETLGSIFLYIGIGFAVFASLMLSNFIATSVSLKKQEIGILRAIGSRSNDVFRIFFAEAFIISIINYILAIAGTITVTLIINSILRNDIGILVTILSFGIRQLAVLLLISLFVAFIATFLPVKKIASKKPIDAIRNR